MYRLLALVGRSAPAAGCLGRYTRRPASAPRPIGGALVGRPSPGAALGCSSSARLGEQASRTPAITGCAHGPSLLALVGRLAASRGGGLARSRLVGELADDGRLPLPRHRAASRAAMRAYARPWRRRAWHRMVSVRKVRARHARRAYAAVCARHAKHGVRAAGASVAWARERTCCT